MNESVERVAVVVVTYNSEAYLPDFLASLEGGLEGVSWNLLVADNASHDGSIEKISELAPAARIVKMPANMGYAAGINAAVASSDGHTAILVLNPDVRLARGCVSQLLLALREPGIGIAVPKLVDGGGNLIASMRREPTVIRALADAILGGRRAGFHPRLGELVSDPREYESAGDTDWAEGAIQLIGRECWQRTGPWDESFFLYSEETEFDLRARDNGFATRFVPEAAAVHLRGDSRTSAELWALLTVNRVRLFVRRKGRARGVLFWLAIFARELSRSVLGRQTSAAAVRALIGKTPTLRAPT